MLDLNRLPLETGVYIFKNREGQIIYIGKANSIRNRVKQYFQQNTDKRYQVEFIREETAEIDYRVTENEYQALILEYNLIKKHRPRYNVKLKDTDKYPYIKISGEKFPSIDVVFKNDGAGVFFGPYTSVLAARTIVDAADVIFNLRRCKGKLPKKECIERQMGKCGGVCVDGREKEIYGEKIDSVIKLLRGRSSDLLKMLSVRMEEEAGEENFEKATVIRDSIRILRSQLRRGKNIGIKEKNRDVAAIAREGRTGVFVLLKLRGGMVSDILLRRFNASEKVSDYMALRELLFEHYTHTTDFDIEQVVTPFEMDAEEYDVVFKERKVSFVSASAGEINRQLYDTAFENGLTHLHSFISKEYVPKGVLKMKSELQLEKMPRIVAGVDISHFSGKWSSGAVVVFKDFKPLKSAYRYYKIEDIGNDDYRSMEHVLTRFLEKYKIDILLVDGGLGQMNVAKQVKRNLNLDFPIFALAKKFNTLYNEDGKIISFLPYSKTNMLLKSVRDESHRFANKLRKIRMEKL